jgi:peptide deformylase
MIKELLKIGNPSLRQLSEHVSRKEIKSKEIKQLINDMMETMKDAKGVGIAAPQIGINKRISIITIKDKLEVIVNPVIIPLTEEVQGFWEGCLSVPEFRGYVERPKKIALYYLNELGEAKYLETNSFLAAVIQHEVDHLDGSLYVDKIKDNKQLIHNDEYSKLINKVY